MPDPIPLPMRILVRGASTVGYSGVMGGPRSDFTFPRVIERDLLASGRPATVMSLTKGGMRTATVLDSWESDVLGWSPDVVVIMAAHYETLHVLWPQWLERHANSVTWAPRRWGSVYRKRLLRPVWRFLVKVQANVEQRVPRGLWRRRIDNAVADIGKAISWIRQIGSPLVIVMEVPMPSEVAMRHFPGLPERVSYANDRLAGLVATVGESEVRLFPTNEITASYAGGDLVAALPDGFHFAPDVHDMVGRRLASEIEAWALTQPHLKS